MGRKVAANSKKDYYSKFLKNGFFKFLGKDKIAKKVILRRFTETQEVRFFEFEDLKRMVEQTSLLNHRLMLWLLFDTGIEINAIIQLVKKDFTKEYDETTKTDFWMLHVRHDISKKSRSKRDLYIHFQETNQLLDIILPRLDENDRLFNFSPRNAYKVVQIVTKKLGIKVKPINDDVSLKDFRSSMATYFLKIGWSTDEVKGRLGHKPSSSTIDRYVSYLGLNQKKKRQEAVELDFKNYQEKYSEAQETIRKLKTEQDTMRDDMKEQFKSLEEKRKPADELLSLLLEDKEILSLVMKKIKEKKTGHSNA